jgi:hypothetical protein
MRCKACNSLMSATDLARRNPHTGDYDDMCGKCLNKIVDSEMPVSVRFDDNEDSMFGYKWLEALVDKDTTSYQFDYMIEKYKK